MESTPQYSFSCTITDETTSEIVSHSSTPFDPSQIKEDEWGLISCDPAEQTLFTELRYFHTKGRAEYERKNYQQEEDNENE